MLMAVSMLMAVPGRDEARWIARNMAKLPEWCSGRAKTGAAPTHIVVSVRAGETAGGFEMQKPIYEWRSA